MAEKLVNIKPDKFRKRIVCTLEERKGYALMIRDQHSIYDENQKTNTDDSSAMSTSFVMISEVTFWIYSGSPKSVTILFSAFISEKLFAPIFDETTILQKAGRWTSVIGTYLINQI